MQNHTPNGGLTAADVLAALEHAQLLTSVPSELTFSLVTHDSRQIESGALFVALRGTRDGHEFIPDAYRRGAIGAIGDRPIDLNACPSTPDHPFAYFLVEQSLGALQQLARYWRLRHHTTVVGVTGSVGKTTTKDVIAGVLGSARRVLKSEASFNNEIGLPLTLLKLRPQFEVAVVEMGMYTLGEIASLCRIAQPRIGVVTNVQPVHLERVGTIERIAQAKAEIVEALPPDGLAVLSGDDPRVRAMASQTEARAVYYGLDPSCDYRATAIESRGLAGIRFTLEGPNARIAVESPLIGRHSVYACLAAAAVADAVGLTAAEVAEALSKPLATNRLVVHTGPNGSRILDDSYNASPASVRAALDVLAEIPGRRIAVLGDMLELGDVEQDAHREIGEYAARIVDRLVAVGERGRWIGEAAERVGHRSVAYAADPGGVQIDLGPDDTVLIKGSRGVRLETLVARLLGGQR